MANKKITDYTEILAAGIDDFLDISVDLGGGVYETRKIKASNIGGASPLTTKGDLFTYDTADARLPIGTDGQALIADSAEATGLRWGSITADNMATADLTLTGLRTHDLAGNVLKFDNGQVTIEGAGSTNATTSLLIQNSLATQMLKIDDSGGFALGKNANYEPDPKCVTIGQNANTNRSGGGSGAVAIGDAATAIGVGSSGNNIAIGRESKSIGSNTISIGYQAGNSVTSGGNSAILIGNRTAKGVTTLGTETILIGDDATGTTIQGLGIGTDVTVNGNFGLALGRQTTVNNTSGIALGHRVTSSATRAYIIGNGTGYRTNSTNDSFEVNFNETTSTFRFGKSVDGWLDSTGGFVFGASTVDSSAALQVDSTTKGFLPPRMTTTEKNAISTPATGLVVFDSTLAKLCVYTGASWETVTSA
jgi:hypothetical protein